MCWPCWGVTSVTLSELSLRNARRQAKDYLVYFVTIVLAAALVYAFNGLIFSQELQSLATMMDALPLIIVLTSMVVVCIIGWLVQYTTGFMLTRRSRELGTYILIGLESRQVARLFFLENLAVGGVALALGVLVGNLLFQALRAVTLALFQVPYTFSFAFSWKALALTLAYFAAIYLLALWKSRGRIKRMKIGELMDYDRKNEQAVLQKSRGRRRIFTLSIICGVIGTVLILLQNLFLGLLGAALIIVFLYGFFLSFSSGVPAWFDRKPERKYKGQRLVVFRALSAKLATMGVVMATIALLFTGTLISEGSGLVFHAMFDNRNQYTTCFDLFIASIAQEEDHFDGYLAYVDENIPVEQARRYQVYRGQSAQVSDFILANADYWTQFDYDTVMKASDYAAMRALSGIRDEMDFDTDGYDTIFAKGAIEDENASLFAMIVFPLYYLALILTLVSATILTIQQLSEAERYRRQFELLRKLGMERREMRRTLRRQFAIFYTLPALPPLLIGCPFILGMSGMADPGMLGTLGLRLMILGVALALFLSIYLVYIVMAYVSMKRAVLPTE